MTTKTPRLIIPGSYGNPRKLASQYPYDADAVEARQQVTYPKPHLTGRNIIGTSNGAMRRNAATLAGGGSGLSSTGGMGASMAQSPLFYDYRWSSPDKFYFPRNRVVANSIWREIYKRDPTIAIGTDMYAELPWSEFDLIGLEDPVVKHIYQDMFNTLKLEGSFPQYTRDYLIHGEFIPHAIFNSDKGIWQRVISHNPDYIIVENVGLVMDQPLLKMRPTPEIKKLINSTDPRMKRLQKLLPKEIVHAFRENKEIPLDPLNTSYLARINTSGDQRGSSLYTRLYRIVMYEDFIVNASLAVAQRNAAPLRIFKLGDPNTGWLPDENEEAAFADMLSMAESDPLAAIIMHHNISVELVGTSDRVLLISREWDFIERVKLLAMGVARSFLVGESSFAASVAGLQTLIQRLAALRSKFTNEWIVNKLCVPIAQINGFYKRPESELAHRVRIKDVDDLPLMVPKIKWKKVLEPNEDVSRLNIWRDLKDRGLVSDRTYTAGAGVDLDVERSHLSEEKTYKDEHPELYGIPGAAPAGPGGAAPAPGGAFPMKSPPPGAAPAPALQPKKQHAKLTAEQIYALEDDITSIIEGEADMDNNISKKKAVDIARDIANIVADQVHEGNLDESHLSLIEKILPPSNEPL